MFKKLNTFLVTNYPSIWRSKIIYILPIVIFLSLLTPFNRINTEKSLKELENIGRKISDLEEKLHEEQYNIETKHPELEAIFNKAWRIQRALREKRGRESSSYEYSRSFSDYSTKKLENLYLNQRQEIAKKEAKGLKKYLSNLEKMEELEIKEYKLSKSIPITIINEERSRNIINYAIFIWVVLIYVWLYIQYLSPAHLKNYSFFSIFRVNILNSSNIALSFIPLLLLVFFTVENLSEMDNVSLSSYYSYSLYGTSKPQKYYLINLLNISYLFLLPIVFISTFVRYYTFSEIIIVIIGGVLYVSLLGFSLANILTFDSFLMTLHTPFILILFYVIYRLHRKRYGKLTRMLIFLVLGTGHLFIAFTQSVLFFPKSTLVFSYSDSYSHYEYIYDSYHTFTLTHWITLYASTFIFMTLLTWYFARALQQPRAVR